jgi:multiple sugar transport system permease protein
MHETFSPVVFRRRLSTLGIYSFLSVTAFTMLLPFAWMILTSLNPMEADPFDLKRLWPGGRGFQELRFDNYSKVMFETGLVRAFLNSAFISATITLMQVFTSSLAGFAFARLQFFARDRIFLGYLATMMVPGTVTMIPMFILMRELGWIDTYRALIIPAMFSAYGTFMLRQFLLTIPASIQEAAMLDGCSTMQLYWHVMLPLARPALAALAIITFMNTWRAFIWPLVVAHDPALYPLPVALTVFQDAYDVRWPLLMAGSVLMILPMVAVFLFGQRFLVEGITVGGVKG